MGCESNRLFSGLGDFLKPTAMPEVIDSFGALSAQT